ncbi:MAG: hypothetical protein AB1491_00155 [Thermodesulfobacteriota bacterium]
MAFAENPQEEVRRRVLQLAKEPAAPAMDEKELAEREEAAQAYATGNEQHFVDYCQDCIDTSVQAMTKIRQEQQECWNVYNEEPPPNYAQKEPWQSQVIIPKPYGAVQFAMSIVRKAFDVQFLSIDNEQNREAAEFWEKLMGLLLSRNYADFPIQFTDACGMGFAVGQSMEMIPVWRTGKGLRYILVEPWKIHRDPDAISRQPQSGMYWVHQEWLDYWLLRKFQKDGRYRNVSEIAPGTPGSAPKSDPHMTKEAVQLRKDQAFHRSKYRTMILTSEFWGTVLDSKGELLLPNATYTVANGKVISLPKKSPYPTLRWPGMGFSPLPHLLRFDGRGLLQGIKSLWYFMCSLLCLHNDNLNWVVNPPTEIDVSALVDQEDVDDYPGKKYLTRGTVSGQQAVRTVERKSVTNEVLANENFAQQRFEEGTFITNLVRGLPGYRAEVTARESAQSLEQALTVFSLIGKNLEQGALNAIVAGAETVALNLTYDELVQLMGQDWAQKYADPSSPTGLRLPQLTTGAFHVSGISALMRDWEIIRNIRDIFLPCFENQIFIPYLKPYRLLRALEVRLNLKDEGIVVDEGKAAVIDAAQQGQQEQSIALQALAEQAATQQAVNEALAVPPATPAEGGMA